MQQRLVQQTAARFRKDVSWLYRTSGISQSFSSQKVSTVLSSPCSGCSFGSYLTPVFQQGGGRRPASSQAVFNWGHKLPARVQAAAGIAAEVERDNLLQQKQQQQPQLQETSLLRQPPASSSSSQLHHTGAFARLPMVPVSTEIIESALKRAGRIAANTKLKNEAQKARSRYSSSLQIIKSNTKCVMDAALDA